LIPYEVRVLPEAASELAALSREIADRIVLRLRWLASHLDVVRPAALHGSLRGFYKLRVGRWRVIYTLDRDAHIIYVHLIGARDDIYKGGR